jgi:cell division protein FtsQ
MTFKWKKAAIVVADVVIAVYLLLAMTIFNKPYGDDAVCRQVKIDIKGGLSNGFLNADEIKKLLESKHLYPLGKPLQSINTRQMEEFLCNSPFVDDAQCYKTGDGNVCVTLTQRTPVVRVKADNGDDYYVDNHGGLMPNTKYVADIIIATGHIDRKYACKVLSRVGSHIASDKFWSNQVVQINVLADGSMEIVPRVGDHIVYLGEPTSVQSKLKRMEKFYKYGLSQAGWNKYSYISVEFYNQIICKRKQNNTEGQ